MRTLSGEKLKNLRMAAGISQEVLADRANMFLDGLDRFPINAKSLISQWESHGPAVRSETQEKRISALARVLECDMNDLYVGDTSDVFQYWGEWETNRLREYGFMPGFFSFLASAIGGTSIETLGVKYCRRTNSGFVSNGVEPFFNDVFCMTYNAVTETVSDGGPGREYLRRVPDDINLYDDMSDGAAIDSVEPGAIIHYAGKKNDQFMALSDLLQLQARLGSFARFSMNEMLDAAAGATRNAPQNVSKG